MSRSTYLLLVLLALLWGSAYFFNSLILRELPPLTLVLGRVALGAAILVPIVMLAGLAWPASPAAWAPFAGMAVLNNVIPFCLIVVGQTEISSGLASVLNATTPLFSVLLAHLLVPGERITALRLAGVLCGIAGVAVLFAPDLVSGRTTTAIGMMLVLGAALSYGCAGVWGQRFVAGAPPLLSACCQLVSATLMMLVLAAVFDRPWRLPVPGATTWAALAGLAALSTATAYVVFYRILAVSGGTNVMLTTLLMPVVAILLGAVLLGESLEPRFLLGTLIIAAAIVIIDGRAPRAVLASLSRR